MSHWDFSRRPEAEYDAGPSDTAYQPDLMVGLGTDDARGGRDVPWPGGAPGLRPDGDGTPRAPWPARNPRSAPPLPESAHRPGGDGWPPRQNGSAGEGWPPGGGWDGADDSWDEDEGTAPYPITYERDDFLAAAPEPAPPPAAPPGAPREPWPPAPFPDGAGARHAGGAAPGNRDAGPWPAADAAAAHGWPTADSGPPGETFPGWDGADGGWDEDGRRYGHGGRRWLILAGVVVAGAAVGAAAGLLAGRGGQAAGTPAAPPATPAAQHSAAQHSAAQHSAAQHSAAQHSATQHSAAPSSAAAAGAPLTLAQAQAVVTRYTTVNNSANAQRSDALLATIETGSSYAIDAGVYQARQGKTPYPAFTPARAAYYIPRGEPAAGPRWFVVQVANVFSSNPDKVTSSEYLLFTQQAPGGPWQDTAEPYLLSGGDAPRIAVGADGLATAVGPDATSVAVAPARLPAATAASLDGTAAGAGQAAVAVPGNLADVSDERSWQGKLTGGTVTDAHSPAAGTAGREYALRTADGGALVFYTDAAQLTITPPAGAVLHLTVPGFYSSGQALSRAGLSYLDQFAAYDPPAGGGNAPGVVADYSGITGAAHN